MKLIAITYLVILIATKTGCSDTNDVVMDAGQVDANTNEAIKQSSLEPIAYVQWIEDKQNGLLVEKQIGEYTFSAQYKPLEYLVLKDTKNPSIKAEELKKGTDEMSDLQYFTFKVGVANKTEDPLKYGVSGNVEFQKRVDYFSFHMQNEIKLIDGIDSLNCLLFHFERTYGIVPYCTFLLGFEKSKTNLASKTLVYNDQLLGVGPVKLMIQADKLKQVPTLITL